MKLLSHERLEALQEQLDYLEKMYSFVKTEYVKANPHALSPEAIGEYAAGEAFALAGLTQTVARLHLEIAFLKDFLDVEAPHTFDMGEDVAQEDAAWLKQAEEARKEGYVTEDEVGAFLHRNTRL